MYNLRPNSSYSFQLYAINKLGNGQRETVSTVTKYSIEEINEAITLLSEKGMASLYLKLVHWIFIMHDEVISLTKNQEDGVIKTSLDYF